MKVVYHPRYEEVYENDPAAEPGRMESIVRALASYEFVRPEPATLEDVLLVHTEEHVRQIQRRGLTYEVGLLAVGGALEAARWAMAGEPAFGLIRPPGHHASPGHGWGFCFFNNVAVSVGKLLFEGKIERAVILDFDLHFGDGTAKAFEDVAEVVYCHPKGLDRRQYLEAVAECFSKERGDIVAVSAGFDRHEQDWGRLLKTEDYERIGGMVKAFAMDHCGGRRYGVLEGGYNHDVLGVNVRAFLEGMG